MKPPLAFTWIRVGGESDGTGVEPGLYVRVAEVARYLSDFDSEDVRGALEALAVDPGDPTETIRIVA